MKNIKFFFLLFSLSLITGLNISAKQLASDNNPEDKDYIMATPPYLQDPSTDQMTVMWITKVPCRSWVEYGTDSTDMKRAAIYLEGMMVANNKINSIKLDGLEPGTKYFYRVVSEEITLYSSYKKEFGKLYRSPVYSFTTWNDKNKDITVLIYNDLHTGIGVFNKLHELVKNTGYELVIFNGDCFTDPEREEDIVNTLKGYSEIYGSQCVPSIYMRGNHETRGAYSPLLWNYLGRKGEHSYSAFNLGDTRFVLLDCGEDKPDSTWVYYDMNDFTQYRIDQADFLRQEVRKSQFKKADKRILIHHIPIYGERMAAFNPCGELWQPILSKAPFTVAINGHMHNYEFFEKGEKGNNFPVIIGGGPAEHEATVMILKKTGARLNLTVLNIKGEELFNSDL